MKRYALLCLLILLLPVIFSSPAQAMRLEKYEKTETLYSYEGGNNAFTFKAIWALAWSPDGRYLAASLWDNVPNSTRVWDMENEELVFSESKRFDTLEFSPDSRYLAGAGGMNRNITVIRTDTWETVFDNWTGQKGTISISWSPNGSYIASGGEDGSIVIFESDSWIKFRELRNFTTISEGFGATVSWSPDGKSLAYGGTCGNDSKDRIIIWNTSDWSIKERLQINTLEFRFAVVYVIAWSPDSWRLAVGIGASTFADCYRYHPAVYVWNSDSWKNADYSIVDYGDSKFVQSLQYTPDSKYLLIGTIADTSYYTPDAVTVILLDGESLDPVETVAEWYPNADYSYSALSVSVSPDGRIAIAGMDVSVYEKHPDYFPLYKYIVIGAVIVIIALLYMKRRRKNLPDVKLEEREAKDPVMWRYF